MAKPSEVVTDPGATMAHVKELRAQADEAEASAIKAALGLTAGNAHHAAVLLGLPIGTLTAMLRPDRRHADLAGYMARRRGRPPTKDAAVMAAAHSVPKRIAEAMPLTKGKAKLKPLPKLPKLKAKPKAKPAVAKPKSKPKAPKVAPKLKALPKLPAAPAVAPEAPAEAATS